MTPQSNFMVVATVREGQLDPLRSLLAGMNKSVGLADPDNELVPFGRFDRLHMARFVILEAVTAKDIEAYGRPVRPWQPALAFLGDCDGSRNSFLAELAEVAGEGLSTIFSHCEGFPDANSRTLLQWLKSRNIKPAANYVNWQGRTVRQVHEEAALHDCLSAYLPSAVAEVGRENTRALRQHLLSHVEMQKNAGLLKLSPEQATPWCWLFRNGLHKIGIPLILLLLLPVFLILAPFFALWLRMAERSDPELFIRPTREHIKALAYLEDREVSNQFNVFGYIKPGLFRLLTFKFFMLLTDYVARHIYKRGFLTRIKTIHFARWVFIDDNRRAFFASNYDGSHEAYMDDFINKAGWGLNVAFCNAIGYPTTRWVIKDGAEREQQFKYTQRRHQIPSQVWYKAYPDLTANDLARNARIRRGVEVRQNSDAEIRAWLSEI